MAERMDDESLLAHLQALESESSGYTWGKLGKLRERAMRDYFREPYGNEEEGWSSVVTSEVFDTIEWLLPDLLKVFTSTDKAVTFDPTQASDVKGAQQATDSVNYVFYKQNNGFLILYTAIKDALMAQNCAVMWFKETVRTPIKQVLDGTTEPVTDLHLRLHEQEGWDVEPGEEVGEIDFQGAKVKVYSQATLKRIDERVVVRVESFPPEELQIKRNWTSPLLQECPYVARIMPVTLSEIHQMGFDHVTAEDLAESDDAALSADKGYRQARMGDDDAAFTVEPAHQSEDDSLTEGFLRIEYVLADYDGDGIAERRCIYRLKDMILSNEEESHVPFATASPILITHRWNGLSIWETVKDLQELKTELTRQVLNSAYLSNNPRKKVLTSPDGTPYANIDDLLDSRIGGVMRHSKEGAITDDVTPFVGGQMFPLLEYVDGMREQRTGVSRRQTGMDANALRDDRTAAEVRATSNAANTKKELIARIFAELLLKPMFQGIFKLLSDGDIKQLAFRLRDEFVEYNPTEWRDGYDMTVNVGLGTGDREQQFMYLQGIYQNQIALAQSPFGPSLIDAEKIYNTQAKLVENAGFKNAAEFWKNPKLGPPPQVPQPPPDPRIVTTQMQLQADAQKFQAQQAADERQRQLDAQLQAAIDQNRQEYEARQKDREQEREAQLEAFKAALDKEAEERQRQFDAWKAELESNTRIAIAQIGTPEPADESGTLAQLQTQYDEMTALLNAPRKVLRDPVSGKPTGLEIGGKVRQLQRDETGRIVGI